MFGMLSERRNQVFPLSYFLPFRGLDKPVLRFIFAIFTYYLAYMLCVIVKNRLPVIILHLYFITFNIFKFRLPREVVCFKYLNVILVLISNITIFYIRSMKVTLEVFGSPFFFNTKSL